MMLIFRFQRNLYFRAYCAFEEGLQVARIGDPDSPLRLQRRNGFSDGGGPSAPWPGGGSALLEELPDSPASATSPTSRRFGSQQTHHE